MLKTGILWCALLLAENIHAQDKKKPSTQPDIKSQVKETQLASKKDVVCGMPAYKFLKDTTLYDKKIYGFCGKGCKVEFLKNPTRFTK